MTEELQAAPLGAAEADWQRVVIARSALSVQGYVPAQDPIRMGAAGGFGFGGIGGCGLMMMTDKEPTLPAGMVLRDAPDGVAVGGVLRDRYDPILDREESLALISVETSWGVVELWTSGSGGIDISLFTVTSVVRSCVALVNCAETTAVRFLMNGRMLLGGGTIVLVTCLAILFGAPLVTFIDLPSLILVLGATLAVTVWSCSLQDIFSALRSALLSSSLEEDDAVRGQAVFNRAADGAVAAGTLGTLIGLVQMLQQMDDPSAIGPAMAVALLTLLYGVLLGELCLRSMGADLAGRSLATSTRRNRQGSISIYATVGSLMIFLATFFVMLLAMANSVF